uniref:Uncharacterized protein n=1 Tax=Opuntia streptacantha TaxID=393608 RepID=A0A7C9DF78_OPUST
MNKGVVLNIGSRANTNAVHITSQDTPIPNGGAMSNLNISNNRCTWCHKRIPVNYGSLIKNVHDGPVPGQLFGDVIVALKAISKTIDGLTSLPDPLSHSVNCLSQSTHLLLLLLVA